MQRSTTKHMSRMKRKMKRERIQVRNCMRAGLSREANANRGAERSAANSKAIETRRDGNLT
jgi:hypothetical protein